MPVTANIRNKPTGPDRPPVVLSLLLHAHLPYLLQPTGDPALEECWLFEATLECYLPLLERIERLPAAPGPPLLSLSLSPTLLEMWCHPAFPQRFLRHLAAGTRILEAEASGRHHPPERRALATRLLERWNQARISFDRAGCDLAGAFARVAGGTVELLTTAATHAFLPAYQNRPRLCDRQVATGIESFERATGLSPATFWLPECGYFPGLEDLLARHGIRTFALDERGIRAARPAATVRAPLQCPNGVLALGRDAALSRRVWSARAGYPGHPDYREFHHDAVHQLPADAAGPFALPDGGRMPLGLKYWRVSGGEQKHWYEPQRALARARSDACDFVDAVAGIPGDPDRPALAFVPFDAELFGHWWYEGPEWLEAVLEAAAQHPGITLAGAGAAAALFPDSPAGQPAASSWGLDSDYSFWVNRDTDWIYPLIESAADALDAALVNAGGASPERRRVLAQAQRELLLAQASDWPFMLRAGTTTDYANQRLRTHLQRFHYLLGLSGAEPDGRTLELIEMLDPVFGWMDPRRAPAPGDARAATSPAMLRQRSGG